MNASQVGSTIEKRVLENKKKSFVSGPFNLKMLSQVRLDPRSPNMCLDFKQLDGKGIITVIKHTSRHECQVGSTIEKRDLENEKIFISSSISLKMLRLRNQIDSFQGIIPGRRSETGIKVFDFKLTETLVSTYLFIFLTNLHYYISHYTHKLKHYKNSK